MPSVYLIAINLKLASHAFPKNERISSCQNKLHHIKVRLAVKQVRSRKACLIFPTGDLFKENFHISVYTNIFIGTECEGNAYSHSVLLQSVLKFENFLLV